MLYVWDEPAPMNAGPCCVRAASPTTRRFRSRMNRSTDRLKVRPARPSSSAGGFDDRADRPGHLRARLEAEMHPVTVKDVMTWRVISVGENTRFKDIAQMLHTHTVSALPVVGDDGQVV